MKEHREDGKGRSRLNNRDILKGILYERKAENILGLVQLACTLILLRVFLRLLQGKLRHTEIDIADLQRETRFHLDDLDVLLVLLANLPILYSRLDPKQKSHLLQIIAKRIIISPEGTIIDHELNSPFVYLRMLVGHFPSQNESGSEQVTLGAQKELTANCFQLSGLNKASDPLHANEQFLDLVRFKQRSRLDELPDGWKLINR